MISGSGFNTGSDIDLLQYSSDLFCKYIRLSTVQVSSWSWTTCWCDTDVVAVKIVLGYWNRGSWNSSWIAPFARDCREATFYCSKKTKLTINVCKSRIFFFFVIENSKEFHLKRVRPNNANSLKSNQSGNQ